MSGVHLALFLRLLGARSLRELTKVFSLARLFQAWHAAAPWLSQTQPLLARPLLGSTGQHARGSACRSTGLAYAPGPGLEYVGLWYALVAGPGATGPVRKLPDRVKLADVPGAPGHDALPNQVRT